MCVGCYFFYRKTRNKYKLNENSIGKMSCGESRSELVAWINATTGLGLAKIEQCGTGAALCQIMDTLFGRLAVLDILCVYRRCPTTKSSL